MKGLRWRVITVFATVLFALYLLVPTILKFGFGVTIPKTLKADDPWVYSLLPSETLKLGLDLQGGLHLVLGIDFEEVRRGSVQKLASQVRELAEQNTLAGITVEAQANRIRVSFQDEAIWRKLDSLIGKEMGFMVDFVSQDASSATLTFSEEYAERIRTEAVEQSLETLRNRIDEFGIAEPTIQRQGDEKILVQFPGVSDTGRLKDIISRTAKLSFQIVQSGPETSGTTPSVETMRQWVAEFEKEKGIRPDPLQPMSAYVRQLNQYLEKKLPAGTEILFRKESDINTREMTYIPYLLDKLPMVTGEDLQDASYGYDSQTNDPQVNFELTPSGATKFEKATTEHVRKYMAIVLDNNVHSAPQIRERIPGGRAKIDMKTVGRGLQEALSDAKDTALVLRSGALPARLLFLEERVIGPSLGADAIQSGVRSFSVGLGLVLILMFVYYRGSGLVAFTALSLNAVFVLALMASFEGTLTLPGLAGLTLTLGMAVDANVLIFEHIREELRMGKSVNSAIGEGFARAWTAILDGNLTTMIAGLVLISFGYGPIRGFAVTTLIGLTCSMYTAVFVTRVVFDYVVVSKNRKTLSI